MVAVVLFECLAFRLGGAEYGIDIRNVQEIRSYEQPAPVPYAPSSASGVINLRGVIVPIIDLRVRLGHPADITAFTVVIVLNVKGYIVGVVADSVSDVVELSSDQVRPVDEYPSDKGGFVVSTAAIGDRTLLFMDLSGLLSDPD